MFSKIARPEGLTSGIFFQTGTRHSWALCPHTWCVWSQRWTGTPRAIASTPSAGRRPFSTRSQTLTRGPRASRPNSGNRWEIGPKVRARQQGRTVETGGEIRPRGLGRTVETGEKLAQLARSRASRRSLSCGNQKCQKYKWLHKVHILRAASVLAALSLAHFSISSHLVEFSTKPTTYRLVVVLPIWVVWMLLTHLCFHIAGFSQSTQFSAFTNERKIT